MTLASDRARRERRRAAGLCIRCGEPALGKSLCPRHLETSLAETYARRGSIVAAGICSRCMTAQADDGTRWCATCKAEARAVQRDRDDARRALGLCIACNAQVVGGKSLCQRHLDAARDRQRAKK